MPSWSKNGVVDEKAEAEVGPLCPYCLQRFVGPRSKLGLFQHATGIMLFFCGGCGKTITIAVAPDFIPPGRSGSGLFPDVDVGSGN